MTRTVVVTVEMTDSPATFPHNTVVGFTQITLMSNGAQIAQQTVSGEPCVATFEGVPAGVITAIAKQVDPSGIDLGTSVTSAEFTVDPDPISIRVPLQISISAS